MSIALTVNGRAVSVAAVDDTPLLDVLRTIKSTITWVGSMPGGTIHEVVMEVSS